MASLTVPQQQSLLPVIYNALNYNIDSPTTPTLNQAYLNRQWTPNTLQHLYKLVQLARNTQLPHPQSPKQTIRGCVIPIIDYNSSTDKEYYIISRQQGLPLLFLNQMVLPYGYFRHPEHLIQLTKSYINNLSNLSNLPIRTDGRLYTNPAQQTSAQFISINCPEQPINSHPIPLTAASTGLLVGYCLNQEEYKYYKIQERVIVNSYPANSLSYPPLPLHHPQYQPTQNIFQVCLSTHQPSHRPVILQILLSQPSHQLLPADYPTSQYINRACRK